MAKGAPCQHHNALEPMPRALFESILGIEEAALSILPLGTVFQKADEPLKNYIARFQKEVSCVESPSDDSVLTAIIAGLRKDGELYRSIYNKPVKTLRDFYKRSNTYIRMKEAFGLKKHPKKYRSKSSRSRNRLEEGRRGYNRSRHRVSRRDDAAQVQVAKKARNDEKRRGGGHYQTFSQLTDSQYHNTG
ncbi:hypothetical protein ACOSP7_031115 [Xanthoceras sorbifolium]